MAVAVKKLSDFPSRNLTSRGPDAHERHRSRCSRRPRVCSYHGPNSTSDDGSYRASNFFPRALLAHLLYFSASDRYHEKGRHKDAVQTGTGCLDSLSANTNLTLTLRTVLSSFSLLSLPCTRQAQLKYGFNSYR